MTSGSVEASPAPVELGFGILFEASRDAVVVADVRGNIVLWNRAATYLFGYEKNEALNMNIRQLVPPRLQAAHDRGLQHYRRTRHGSYIDTGAALELPALRKDGIEVVVDLVLSEVPHLDGFVMAIMRDVTDKARLRAEVEADRRQLKSANESLESFSFVVSHDLKEPIRALNAYLDDAQRATDPALQRELIGKALENSANLGRLVQGLLEWSRTSMAPLELEPLHIPDVLRGPECSVMYRQLLVDRQATLKIEPDIPPVLATPGLLCQIIGNLITNSFKHSNKPRPIVHIYASAPEVAGFVDIVVDDNGPGYPDAVLQRFTTLKNKPQTIKGGFGLTITRRAIDRLGGHMSLSNNPAGGGRTHLRFPEPTSPPRPREVTLTERFRDLI